MECCTKRGCPAIAKMHNPNQRQRSPIRNSLRDMWLTHWPKGTVCEGHQARILLAYAHQRCRTNRQDMPSMPKYITPSIKAFGTNTDNPAHLASVEMGHGPSWTTATITRGVQICSSSHRILYKVDRTRQNHIRDIKEFLLAEYNLQIRSTKNPNSWQWETIWLRQLQRILQKYRDQGCLCLSLPPRIQRSSRKS